jgi:hypothetical protein
MRAAVAIITAFGKRRLELKRQLARASRQRALRRRRRALVHSRRTDRSPSRRYVEGDPDRTRRRFSGAGHGEIEAQGADPRRACRRHEDDNNGAAERLAGARPGCTAFAAKTARPLRQATNPNSRQPIIWPSGPSSSAMKERAAIAADPAGCSDRSKPISSDGLPPGRIGSTQISSARRLHGEPGFSRRAIECHVSADWPPRHAGRQIGDHRDHDSRFRRVALFLRLTVPAPLQHRPRAFARSPSIVTARKATIFRARSLPSSWSSSVRASAASRPSSALSAARRAS